MIATDPNGVVVLVGESLPIEWNGMELTLHELSEAQQAAFTALPADRGGTTFDGHTFTAFPAPELQRTNPAAPIETLKADLAALLADPEAKAALKAALA